MKKKKEPKPIKRKPSAEDKAWVEVASKLFPWMAENYDKPTKEQR